MERDSYQGKWERNVGSGNSVLDYKSGPWSTPFSLLNPAGRQWKRTDTRHVQRAIDVRLLRTIHDFNFSPKVCFTSDLVWPVVTFGQLEIGEPPSYSSLLLKMTAKSDYLIFFRPPSRASGLDALVGSA